MVDGRLRGKKALVTGAGKRIGRALALALAEEGVHIVAHYSTSVAEMADVQREVERRGVRFWPLQANFNQPADTESLIARAFDAAGGLDILINSASIFRPGTLQEADFAELVEHMRVNAWTPLVLSREFARRAGSGKIVNLLDTRIAGYDWGHVAYILSKQALATLTRMTAVEFAPKITVNAVAPGLILPPEGKDEAYLRQLAHTVPLLRQGAPEEVSSAVLYLLQSDFVTGQIIYVDGGRHLMERNNGPHSDT